MIINVLSIMGTQLRRLVRYHMGLYVRLSVYRLLRRAESTLSNQCVNSIEEVGQISHGLTRRSN